MFTPFAFIKRQVSAAIASTQRILIAGPFTSFNTLTGSNAAKLINGSTEIDTTFNVGSGANSRILASAIDENDKILIGGQFTTYSGSSQNYITRLNTNGTRDTSFNIGTGFDNSVNVILPVSQSRLLVGGGFAVYSGSSTTNLTRLNSNGTIDSTYANLTFPSSINTVATQSDGKIIVGGFFQTTGYREPVLAKLTSELNPDTTFNPGAGPSTSVYTFATQSDGKIILGGAFTTYSGSSANRIERINTDGTIDTSFNQGVGFNTDVNVIRVQSDGKILVGGTFTSYSGSAAQNRIIRLNSNGTIDSTFIKGTGFNSGTVYDLQLQSDGKIIAVGTWTATYSGSSAIRIARINTSGSLDTTFNTGTGLSGTTYSAQIQNDGKIIVGGAVATYSGSAAARIRRLNTDGTNDTTFNQGTGIATANVVRVKIQPNQKILVIGGFASYSGSSSPRIIRINPDGTKDFTFNPGTGFDNLNTIPSALELDSSGNIYVGSNFLSYSGSTPQYFVKLNPSGSIITGSGNYIGFSSTVNALLVDSTGSIYTGGAFTSYISPNNYIVRLNTDGTKDFSFQIGTGFSGSVNSLVVQPDDKIVVGGNFTSYSGSSNNDIVRLNANGTKDTSFNMGTGFTSGIVSNLSLQSDGKILAMGSFSSYSGSTSYYLTRINTDGTKDTSFENQNTTLINPGGIGNTKSSLVIDNSGSIHTLTTADSSFLSKYVKFNSNGSVNLDGLKINVSQFPLGIVNSLAISNSNNVFILGGAIFQVVRNNNTGIIAFNGSGNTTSSLFNPGVGFLSTQNLSTGYPIASAKTPSGDIWLGGFFTAYSGSNVSSNSYTGVIKINQQGNLITVASSSVGGFYNTINSLQPQSDGKLLIGMDGGYGTYANPVRVNSNGSPDTSFTAVPWLGNMTTIQVQSTGKVLIGGEIGYPIEDGEGGYTTTSPYYFLRLDSSGSLDGTFPLNQTNGPVYTIHTLANDSSILTGAFTYYAATSSNYISKINSEGVRDASYNVGTGFNSSYVAKSALQPDGKLIAAGQFTTYSGSAVNRLARINTDGTLDTTFNPGVGFDSFAGTNSKIVIDNSGNIHIAGGNFTSYSGSAISGYVKILPNGNIDTTAPSGSFVLNQPLTMELLD